jgi:hypothetical protein
MPRTPYTVPKAFLTHEHFHGSTGNVFRTTMKYSAHSNFPYYREMFGSCSWLFFPVVPWKLRETLTVSTGNCSCIIVHAQYENHEQFPGHTGNVSCFSEIFMVGREKISMNNFLPCEEFPSAFPVLPWKCSYLLGQCIPGIIDTAELTRKFWLTIGVDLEYTKPVASVKIIKATL